MKKTNYCKICKSKDLIIVSHEIRETKKKVIQCNKCEVAFLEKFKKIDYRKLNNPHKSKSTNEKNDYKKMLLERSNSMKVVYNNFIKCIKNDKKINLLEIGPGLGAILYLLSKDLKNFKYNFIEKNSFYKKNILSLFPNSKILKNLENNSKLNYGKYSIILLVHVFEHIGEPKKLLKQLNLLLSKNGKVILFLPNYDDYLIKNLKGIALKNYKKTIHHESHLFYYNKNSFRNLINETNFFRIDKIDTIEEYSILNYFNWVITKKPQKNFTTATEVKKNFKKFDIFFKNEIQKKNMGSTLFVILKKNNKNIHK